jgi:5'-nucleotidase
LHILLTNDDGIHAPGIRALWEELVGFAKVTIVAPDSERSATSQAITVHHPIRVDEYTVGNPDIQAWRVSGTPTDCVKLALEAILPTYPDIVVSGINQGPNLGTDVLYSGTVSAAIEGALHGVPAIAVSLDTWKLFDFAPAARFTARLIQKTLCNALPLYTLLNVNVPAIPEMDLTGVAITKLGVRQYENTFERREDPRGRVYYWMGGSIVETANDLDSDVKAVSQGKVSVTPIHFDLTNYGLMNMLEDWKM